jgi:hypothetical protein
MSSSYVYSIRLRDDVRRMMDEMDDINWQTEIKRLVEADIRERKKQRILARAEQRMKEMVPNKVGAATMIREDRDAR